MSADSSKSLDARIGVLRGYYGQQNAGDDAFLFISAWAMKNLLNCTELYANADAVPVLVESEIKPIYLSTKFRGTGRLNQWRDRRICSKADIIAFGGGSNFHSTGTLTELIDLTSRSQHSRIIGAGISVGPFRDSKAEATCKELFSKFSFLGLRDHVSFARVEEMGLADRAKLTFDLAPLLPLACPGISINNRSAEKILGVSLCNYERFVGGDLRAEEARHERISRSLVKAFQLGIIGKVALIEFNRHPVKGDREIHAKIAQGLLGQVPVETIHYKDDPRMTLEAISRMRGVLAMRLHAAIFSFIGSIPFVMLSYHEKCREWAHMIGLHDDLVLNSTFADTDQLVSAIEQIMKREVPTPAMRLDRATELALLNWTQ